MRCQRNRIKLFKFAMIFLYLSVGFLFSGSVTSGVLHNEKEISNLLLYAFVILAALSGLIAVFLLIRESFISSSLILEQWREEE